MLEELKIFLEHLECDAPLITHHTIAMNLSGNFPENKEEILKSLQYSIDNLDEKKLANFRNNKRTL